jgi:hypothetical protein
MIDRKSLPLDGEGGFLPSGKKTDEVTNCKKTKS